MSTVHEIGVAARDQFGKNASRRARKEGLIPAIVYCKGKENRPVFLKSNEWEILSKHDFSVVYLVAGENKIAAIVKDVQINYMKNHVVHIDFQEVDVHAQIHTTLAIHQVGTVEIPNGVLDQLLHELQVSGTALTLPEKIEVNVSDLQLGQSIEVKDIVLPEGVTALTPADHVVFHVVEQKEEAEPAPAPAEEAAADATAAAPDAAAAGKPAAAAGKPAAK